MPSMQLTFIKYVSMFGHWNSNAPRGIKLGTFSIPWAIMPTLGSGLFEQTLPPFHPPLIVMIHLAGCINYVHTNYTEVFSHFQDVL